MVNPTTPPVPTTIAGLPAGTTPLGGAEMVPVSQNGVTVRIAANQFNVVGPTGPAGAAGPTGPTGPAGPPGSGSIAPGSTGQIGYYASNGSGLSPATLGTGLNIAGSTITAPAQNLTGDVTSVGLATTLATVNGNVGAFTAANITVNAKGLITAASSSGSANKVACYQATDTTDIALSIYNTQSNVGASFSMTIPTKGTIFINFSGEIITVTGANNVGFGLTIGSTNYFPTATLGGTGTTALNYIGSTAETDVLTAVSNTWNGFTPFGLVNGIIGLQIEASGIPTGVQTVQVVACKTGANACTLKGTVVTTRINISAFDHS